VLVVEAVADALPPYFYYFVAAHLLVAACVAEKGLSGLDP
jgi:hypothetical protein